MREDASGNHVRLQVQQRLARWLDGPLTVLAFVMLGLLLAQLLVPMDPAWQTHVAQAQTAIWVIFAADFALELLLAPSKGAYLRQNWLVAISVLLPAVRSVRILRAARAIRGASLLRLLTTVNRGTRALEHVARRGQLGYVLGLTVVVTLAGAAGAYYFELDEPNASIQTPGDAIWWAATLVTTVNSPLAVVTLEGRLIGLLLRIYALAVSGYVTAIMAVHLFGLQSDDNAEALQGLRDEVRALRAEVTGRTAPDRNGAEQPASVSVSKRS
jgi:voltage-gated potassium channel